MAINRLFLKNEAKNLNRRAERVKKKLGEPPKAPRLEKIASFASM